jgi:hypothetical protein
MFMLLWVARIPWENGVGRGRFPIDIDIEGKLMGTVEKYYIYKETRNSNQINGENTVKPNIIFDISVRGDTDRLHAPL